MPFKAQFKIKNENIIYVVFKATKNINIKESQVRNKKCCINKYKIAYCNLIKTVMYNVTVKSIPDNKRC